MAAQQQAEKTKPPGTALELVRPEQRGLMQAAADIGALVNRGGLAVIDLSSPEILANYNVLAPTKVMVQANPNFTPSISVVQFDRKRGSLYSLDKKWNPRAKVEEWQTASFGKLELLQIAKAMGLRVRKADTQLGLGASRRDILITAFVDERDVDGTWITHSASQAWIHDDQYERCVAECPEQKWEGKGDDRCQVPMTQADKDAWIAKNWQQRKTMSLRMTDTKALLAAIRMAAAVPMKFPVEDLEKPWIVVRYTFTPDPSDIRIVLAQIEAGQSAADSLYGPTDESAESVRRMIDGDDPAGDGATQTDPATGVQYDPDTGVIEGTCVEDTAQPAGAPQGHGEKPAEDRTIPRGKYANQQLSEICKADPAYAREHFLKAAPPLGVLTEEWLRYWEGEGDEFADVTF